MPEQKVRINGQRRDYDDKARKEYHAKRRNIRFARFLWGMSPNPPKDRTVSQLN